MLRRQAQQTTGELQLPPKDEYDVELILADGSYIQSPRPHHVRERGLQSADRHVPRSRDASRIPTRVLRPGQFVRVRVLGAVRPNAIQVPQQAVLQGAQGHFVVLVDKDNKALMRPVQVGPWQGDDWFITQRTRSGRSGRRRRRCAAVARRTGQGRAGGAARRLPRSNGPTHDAMLSHFFIDRPIFSIVIALTICIAGGVAMFALPIAQYPQVTPVQIQVTATISRRQRHARGAERRRADRAAGQRREQHDLHVVDEFVDGRLHADRVLHASTPIRRSRRSTCRTASIRRWRSCRRRCRHKACRSNRRRRRS